MGAYSRTWPHVTSDPVMTKSELTPYPSQKVHVVEDEDAAGAEVEGADESGDAEDGGDVNITIGVSMTVANGAAVDGDDETGAIVAPPFATDVIIDGAADGASVVGVSDEMTELDGATVVTMALDGAVVSGREKSTLRLNETFTSRNCNARPLLKGCPPRKAESIFSLLYTWIFRRRLVSDMASDDVDAAWLDARVEMAMALISFIFPKQLCDRR